MSLFLFFQFIAIHSDKTNVQSLFETMFDNISPKTIALYKEESLKILSACIVHDARCLVSWKNLHSKRLYQSDLLIKQLGIVSFYYKYFKLFYNDVV